MYMVSKNLSVCLLPNLTPIIDPDSSHLQGEGGMNFATQISPLLNS